MAIRFTYVPPLVARPPAGTRPPTVTCPATGPVEAGPEYTTHSGARGLTFRSAGTGMDGGMPSADRLPWWSAACAVVTVPCGTWPGRRRAVSPRYW